MADRIEGVTILRSRPLDWTRGAGRAKAPRAQAVDVIVPVYFAAEDLRRCLTSIAAETDLARHALTLVIDGPQNPDVESVVTAFAPHISRLLRNETRLGFVSSVNRGMQASSRDVVLLNSDTVVTPRWLEKLIDAAASSGDIGTVTPLSNHATLCSVPRIFEENLLPSGFDTASFAALIEGVSARTYPRLPTGVGVCLLIRRALIDDIGLFDSAHFGLGYGEENDFCLRALERGWLHIADDATFIEHAGHRSFGASRAALVRNATRTLAALHPSYLPAIARFMKSDPLEPVHGRIDRALRARTPVIVRRGASKVVHLVHGWPPFQRAGTELYAYWLVQRQLAWRDVSVFARMSDPERSQGAGVELMDNGARVRLVTNNFLQRNPIARNALQDRVFDDSFERFLEQEKPDLLHIHHLAGHSFSLAGVAKRLGIPIVQQIQDWWSLCGRVNLFDFRGRRCSGPGVAKCAQCAPMTRIAPAPLWNRVLHGLRRRAARRALDAASAFVMGSQFIHDDYERANMLRPGVPAFVLPYGVATTSRRPRAAASLPLRFGIVGSIIPHKGIHVAAAAFRGIDRSMASLHAWGDPSAAPAYVEELREAGGDHLQLEGPFDEGAKEGIFDSIDVLLVPSIGLESFGLAAREAMARGVPVVASRDGALTEMFASGSCGELFPPGDAAALREVILRLINAPAIVDRWSSQIAIPKNVDEHAEEIENVYEIVMGGRR